MGKFAKLTDIQNITAMIAIGDHGMLTGHEKGEICLWTIIANTTNTNEEACLKLEKRFTSDDSSEIRMFTLLPNHRFVASNGNAKLKIWNMHDGRCEATLANSRNAGSVHLSECDAMVALADGLIAVAGPVSPAWGAFDVWNTNTGECLFTYKGAVHRPYGISLATAKGYLVMQPSCGDYTMRIWKISATECTQVSQIPDQRMYDMKTTALGEIVTSGSSVNLLNVTHDGIVKLYQSIPNMNIIDTIIPLTPHQMFIIDRGNYNGGRIRLCNPLQAWDPLEPAPPSFMTIGAIGGIYNTIYSPSGQLIIWHSKDELHYQSLLSLCPPQQPSQLDNVRAGLAEIRKNARLLAQAQRTEGCILNCLPIEVVIEIVLFTYTTIDTPRRRQVFEDHFVTRPPTYVATLATWPF